jgi:glycosyltransferase involved in cell wall biosynthesis
MVEPLHISVLIPAHNEEQFLPTCLDSIETAAARCDHEIERIVIINRCTDRTEEIARQRGCLIAQEDAPNLSRIRNAGAGLASGEVLVTIDADSRMHPRTFTEIARKLESGRYIGGGTIVLLERLSLGIVCSMIVVFFRLVRHGLAYGLFWCRKDDFDAIGGFDEELVSIEDVDFVTRMKAHGKKRGMKFGTLWRAPLTTSCRKFDQFGDWFLVKNPTFLKRVFSGKDKAAANQFWYDPRR